MPCSPDEFFEETWEKMPLFISRPSLRQWYSDWLSEERIFELLADEHSDVQYGFNLDVTAYNGEVRLLCTYERLLTWILPSELLWLHLPITGHLQERQDFNYNSDPAEENGHVEAALVRQRFKQVCSRLCGCCSCSTAFCTWGTAHNPSSLCAVIFFS